MQLQGTLLEHALLLSTLQVPGPDLLRQCEQKLNLVASNDLAFNSMVDYMLSAFAPFCGADAAELMMQRAERSHAGAMTMVYLLLSVRLCTGSCEDRARRAGTLRLSAPGVQPDCRTHILRCFAAACARSSQCRCQNATLAMLMQPAAQPTPPCPQVGVFEHQGVARQADVYVGRLVQLHGHGTQVCDSFASEHPPYPLASKSNGKTWVALCAGLPAGVRLAVTSHKRGLDLQLCMSAHAAYTMKGAAVLPYHRHDNALDQAEAALSASGHCDSSAATTPLNFSKAGHLTIKQRSDGHCDGYARIVQCALILIQRQPSGSSSEYE